MREIGEDGKRDKGLLVFYDWIEPFEELSGDDFKALLLAMLRYSRDGEEPPKFSGPAKIAASFLFPAIDRFKQNAEFGRRGGRRASSTASSADSCESDTPLEPPLNPPSRKSEPPLNPPINPSSRVSQPQYNTNTIQNKNKTIQNETDTTLPLARAREGDADRHEENEMAVEGDESASEPYTVSPDFAEFWDAYPKKVGKREAWRVWQRLKPSLELRDTMMRAVTSQRESEQWRREGGRYIPNPATWLNQGRWDDGPTDTPSSGFAESSNPFINLLHREGVAI